VGSLNIRCRGLSERIRLPTEKLKLIDRKVLDRDEAVSHAESDTRADKPDSPIP
jgi:hypothetical protein